MLMEDNELRNLYRKNGIYKVYINSDDTIHVFAAFQDLEKAILYRDLFESSNWNLDLKGITDLENPLTTPTTITNTDTEVDKNEEVCELEAIDELLTEKEDESVPDNEIEEIDELLNEPENTPTIEEELSDIDELPQKENSQDEIQEINQLLETTLEDTNADSKTPIEAEILNPGDEDEPDDSFDIENIQYKKEQGYCIEKEINGKLELFGVFPTVDEAIEARDYFRKNNWDTNLKGDSSDDSIKDLQVNDYKKKNPNRYIHEEKSGRFRITKRIGDKIVPFGIYEDYDDAVTARDYYEQHGWNVEDREKFKDKEFLVGKDNPNRYISKAHNTYQIYKNNIYFGRFDTLEEAIEARDWLEEHDFKPEFKDKYRRERKKAKVSDNYFENMELF